MSVKKSILAVTIALIILVFVNLINFPNLNVLKVSFQFKETLEIKLCNPTYGLIVFYDSSAETAYVTYKTYADETVLPPYSIGALDGFNPVDTFQYIMPKQCIFIEDDIRQKLKSKNAQQPLRPDKISMPTIQSFKIRINISTRFVTFSLPFGGQEFESQWFELNPDLTQID